jgi:tetratricopeptide (TPR) repeat protein
MKRSPILILVISLAAGTAWASMAPSMAVPSKSPQDQAVSSYNDGIRLREQAWKMEKELEATTDAAKKENIRGKIQKRFEAVVRDQSNAVKANPSFYQAWGELGYAQRRLGKYPEALEAYDTALKLQPGYAEAIEYRGEAYLGLNRVNEAQEAYLTLFDGGDHERAALLGAAMKRWVEERRATPAGVPAEQIDSVAKWIEQRREISALGGAAAASSWQ